jgi:alpha-L-rhamnosidase
MDKKSLKTRYIQIIQSGKLSSIILVNLLLGIAFSTCQLNMSEIRVDTLTCEYLTNPNGIDTKNPHLSWQLLSDQREQKQTAYRLIVASSKNILEKNEGDLWDSGKVKSDQSIQIEYNGKPLESGMTCYWKVRVWDKEDRPSQWSQPAKWSMGLLNPTDWSAEWIGSPDSITAPYYRHSFEVDVLPEQAFIYLASLGYYELYINGEKVGNEVLAPAVSNFSERTYYQTYDVASYLKNGKNSIGIWMGTGWYSPGLPGVKHHSPAVRLNWKFRVKTNIE